MWFDHSHCSELFKLQFPVFALSITPTRQKVWSSLFQFAEAVIRRTSINSAGFQYTYFRNVDQGLTFSIGNSFRFVGDAYFHSSVIQRIINVHRAFTGEVQDSCYSALDCFLHSNLGASPIKSEFQTTLVPAPQRLVEHKVVHQNGIPEAAF